MTNLGKRGDGAGRSGIPVRFWLLILATLVALLSWPALATDLQQAGRQVDSEDREGGAGETGEVQPWHPERGDQLAIGTDVHVPPDTIRRGEIVSIFGNVHIEGIVTGNVVVVGGSVRVSGAVRRDLTGVLSDITLEEGSRVGGVLNNILGVLQDEGAETRGGFVNIEIPFDLPDVGIPFGILGTLLLWLRSLGLVLFFVMLLVYAALAPERIRVISDEMPVRYFAAFFVGLLGYLGLLVVLALLSVSIIGLPLGLLVFILLKWLGMAGMLHHVGRRLALSFGGREISLLGALLFGFAPYALLLIFPWILGGLGFVVGFGVALFFQLTLEIPAVGLILLTRAGGASRRPAPPVSQAAAPSEPSAGSSPGSGATPAAPEGAAPTPPSAGEPPPASAPE